MKLFKHMRSTVENVVENQTGMQLFKGEVIELDSLDLEMTGGLKDLFDEN